jgi:hypothetical protein
MQIPRFSGTLINTKRVTVDEGEVITGPKKDLYDTAVHYLPPAIDRFEPTLKQRVETELPANVTAKAYSYIKYPRIGAALVGVGFKFEKPDSKPVYMESRDQMEIDEVLSNAREHNTSTQEFVERNLGELLDLYKHDPTGEIMFKHPSQTGLL